jgi:hypothetical protein
MQPGAAGVPQLPLVPQLVVLTLSGPTPHLMAYQEQYEPWFAQT